MPWINEYEIDDAAGLLRNEPVTGPAAKFLYDYKEAINESSDGWPYWRYGTKCADDLSAIVYDALMKAQYGVQKPEPTQADVDKAIRKIKHFANRIGRDLKEVMQAKGML